MHPLIFTIVKHDKMNFENYDPRFLASALQLTSNPIEKSADMPIESLKIAHLKTMTVSPLNHFSFAVDVARGVMVHYFQVQEVLGYSPELNPSFLHYVYHPAERATLQNLSSQIRKCLQQFPTDAPYYTFVIGHRLRKANGDYLKVLNHMQPIAYEPFSNLLILNHSCVDVTAHKFESAITFEVQLPPQVPYSRAEITDFFQEVFQEESSPFSKRELMVLRTWVALHSTKDAAEKLAISERTLETHLKNIRRKVDMNRTMDVVLFAKSKGWL